MKTTVGLILMFGVSVLPGCLNRTFTIVTNPPGAEVFVDNRRVGLSPVEIPFAHSGEREVFVLHEAGDVKYDPVLVRHQAGDVAWDLLILDFIGDALPVTIDDGTILTIDMQPSHLAADYEADPDSYTAALLSRATALSERAHDLQKHGPPAAPAVVPIDDR